MARRGPKPACRIITPYGYVAIWQPNHPDAWKGGRILEHRLIMEKHLGRRLRHSEHVHHRDGDRQNNAIENLELMSPSQHVGLHKRAESRQAKLWKLPLDDLRSMYEKNGANWIAKKYRIPKPATMNVLRSRGLYFLPSRKQAVVQFRNLPKKDLRSLYENHGMVTIAKKFEVSYGVVRKSLIAHGIPLKNREARSKPRKKAPFRNLSKKKLETLYRNHTVPELAQIFGIARSTVLLALKDHQILEQRRPRRTHPERKANDCKLTKSYAAALRKSVLHC